jgi:hypothetical protein
MLSLDAESFLDRDSDWSLLHVRILHTPCLGHNKFFRTIPATTGIPPARNCSSGRGLLEKQQSAHLWRTPMGLAAFQSAMLKCFGVAGL